MKTDLSIKAAIYLRAAELVEQGHCKHELFKKDGESCLFARANEFCYHGALLKAATEAKVYDFDYRGNKWPMSDWNDHPDTTAAMVAAKLREQAFS